MSMATLESEIAVTSAAHALAHDRFVRSMSATEEFFAVHADRLSHACRELALRFQGGGRLLVFGTGAEATDAQHVAVEFVHPVLVGKRALPALALTADVAAVSGIARRVGSEQMFAHGVRMLGRPSDVALAISRAAPDAAMRAGLAQARELGMLTIAACGAGTLESEVAADYVFTVLSQDVLVVQEVQETAYHIMWELVHVFLDGSV